MVNTVPSVQRLFVRAFQSCKSRCGSNVYIEEDILENSFPGIDDFSFFVCVGVWVFSFSLPHRVLKVCRMCCQILA